MEFMYSKYKSGQIYQPVPYEEIEQRSVVAYLEQMRLKFTAIPNSTYIKGWKQKVKNREQGLRPGLPDLLIIIKNKLVFIEMKRTKGGRVSPEQKEWIAALNLITGDVSAHVAAGYLEAKDIIDNYLK